MRKNIEIVLDGEDIVDINIQLEKIKTMLSEGVKFNNCSEDEVIQEVNKLQNMYFK